MKEIISSWPVIIFSTISLIFIFFSIYKVVVGVKSKTILKNRINAIYAISLIVYSATVLFIIYFGKNVFGWDGSGISLFIELGIPLIPILFLWCATAVLLYCLYLLKVILSDLIFILLRFSSISPNVIFTISGIIITICPFLFAMLLNFLKKFYEYDSYLSLVEDMIYSYGFTHSELFLFAIFIIWPFLSSVFITIGQQTTIGKVAITEIPKSKFFKGVGAVTMSFWILFAVGFTILVYPIVHQSVIIIPCISLAGYIGNIIGRSVSRLHLEYNSICRVKQSLRGNRIVTYSSVGLFILLYFYSTKHELVEYYYTPGSVRDMIVVKNKFAYLDEHCIKKTINSHNRVIGITNCETSRLFYYDGNKNGKLEHITFSKDEYPRNIYALGDMILVETSERLYELTKSNKVILKDLEPRPSKNTWHDYHLRVLEGENYAWIVAGNGLFLLNKQETGSMKRFDIKANGIIPYNPDNYEEWQKLLEYGIWHVGGDYLWLRNINEDYLICSPSECKMTKMDIVKGEHFSDKLKKVGDSIFLISKNRLFYLDSNSFEQMSLIRDTARLLFKDPLEILIINDFVGAIAGPELFEVRDKGKQLETIFDCGDINYPARASITKNKLWLDCGENGIHIISTKDSRIRHHLIQNEYISEELKVNYSFWIKETGNLIWWFVQDNRKELSERMVGGEMVPLKDWWHEGAGLYSLNAINNPQSVHMKSDPGFIENIDEIDERVWILAENGLFYIDNNELLARKVPGILGTVRFIFKEERHMWVATEVGLFRLNLEEFSRRGDKNEKFLGIPLDIY